MKNITYRLIKQIFYMSSEIINMPHLKIERELEIFTRNNAVKMR